MHRHDICWARRCKNAGMFIAKPFTEYTEADFAAKISLLAPVFQLADVCRFSTFASLLHCV
jgi:hypothetical protein